MNEITERKLNPTEAITQALPRLIEVFVTFYGEIERENITKKFKNMIILGHMKPEEITRIIRKDLENKSEELINEFMDKLQVSSDKKDEFEKKVFGGFYLEYPNLHSINKYIKYLDGNLLVKRDAVEFVSNFYSEINEENIDEFIQNGKLNKLNKLIQEYKQIMEQYKQYKEVFSSYQEYVKNCAKLKEEIEKKYMMLMLREISYLFSDEELAEIENEFNKSDGKDIDDVNEKAKCYFGYHINSVTLIDAFSLDNERMLERDKMWRRDSIIKDRIKYFKNIGINLGDDYQTYIENSDIQKLLPELQELADKIIMMRNEFYNKMLKDYYQAIDDYKKNMARIQQAGLLNKHYEYNSRTYEKNETYVSGNIRKTANGYEVVAILCFSIGADSEYLDHHLIHELNHVYELSLQSVEGEEFSVLCGWDITKGNIGPEIKGVNLNDDGNKREYELFNEIINELIAQEIMEILASSNGYIFNTRENAKIKGGTGYEHTLFLVSHFYQTYKQEIIESRRTGNMTKLFETVGQENFEALNKLFHEFNENFEGVAFYNLMDSLTKKRETVQTRKFEEIKVKRDKLLMAMEEHNKSRIGLSL